MLLIGGLAKLKDCSEKKDIVERLYAKLRSIQCTESQVLTLLEQIQTELIKKIKNLSKMTKSFDYKTKYVEPFNPNNYFTGRWNEAFVKNPKRLLTPRDI